MAWHPHTSCVAWRTRKKSMFGVRLRAQEFLDFLTETRNITLVRALPQLQIPVKLTPSGSTRTVWALKIYCPNVPYISEQRVHIICCNLFVSVKTRNDASYIYTHDVRTFLWRVARSCRACDSPTTRFPRYSGGKPSAAARANRSPLPRFWTRALPLPHNTTAVSPPILRTTRALPRAPRRAKETVLSWSQSGRRRRRVGSLRQGTAICRPRPAFTARLIAWRDQGLCVCGIDRGCASYSGGGLWFNMVQYNV